LKSWVKTALLGANHFPPLHLNKSHDCCEMKEKSSVGLSGLTGMFKYRWRRSKQSKIEFSFPMLQ
jgi:hypothetical protein